MRRPRAILLAALLVGAAALSGCATYSARLGAVRPQLETGQYDAALETVEKARKDKDLLLYYLEKGLILHYADRWAESNEVLELAEDLAADLYTRSISEGVLSLLINDNTISYRAEPFEMAMIPYFRALNYIYLGLREDALVEARKASYFLRDHADAVMAGDEGAALEDSAFLHYFSGMLYEWAAEWNAAFIEYRLAAEVYARSEGLAMEAPPWLGEDLRRTGRRAGLAEQLAQLAETRPALFDAAEGSSGPDAGRGEVVLLLECGYVAHKIQQEANVPILEEDRDRHAGDYDGWALSASGRLRPGWRARDAKIAYWLRIALPEMSVTPPRVTGARVSAADAGVHAATVPVEDLSGRAVKTFEGESGKILLKTLARALAKWATQNQAKKKGEAAGILANIFGAATETADTRSWLTLPRGILMTRLGLPPGTHDLQVDLLGPQGNVVRTETIPAVEVRAGDWTFLSRRVF